MTQTIIAVPYEKRCLLSVRHARTSPSQGHHYFAKALARVCNGHSWDTWYDDIVSNVCLNEKHAQVALKQEPQDQLRSMYPQWRIKDSVSVPCLACVGSVGEPLQQRYTLAANNNNHSCVHTSLRMPRRVAVGRDADEQVSATRAATLKMLTLVSDKA